MTTVAQASRLPGELANRLAAHAPSWILGLLIMLLAVRAALLVSDLAGATAAVPARSVQPPVPAASRKVVDIPSILRANLFGQAPAATGTDAPVTSMNLKLVATFAASDDKKGLAAIGPSVADVRVYKVGDQVPGGVLLHAVYVDRVLLDRGGSIEALLMPPRNGLSVAPTPQPTAVNPGVSAARVQQVVRDNPGLINQVIQRMPIVVDGRLRGMRVNPGPNAQAFARLGLRPNDIITAINGTQLDDLSRSNEVFNTLSSSAEAHVTVDRNGRTQDLALNLAQIANDAERLAEAPSQPAAAPEMPPGPDSER